MSGYGLEVSPQIRRLAELTLASTEIYIGDHGFSGRALDAWNFQRLAALNVLLQMTNGWVSQSDYLDLRNALCPRVVGGDRGDFEAFDGVAYRTGTAEGAGWVERAIALTFELEADQRSYSHDYGLKLILRDEPEPSSDPRPVRHNFACQELTDNAPMLDGDHDADDQCRDRSGPDNDTVYAGEDTGDDRSDHPGDRANG